MNEIDDDDDDACVSCISSFDPLKTSQYKWIDILPICTANYLDLKSIMTLRRTCTQMYYTKKFSLSHCIFDNFSTLTEQEFIFHVLPCLRKFLTAQSMEKLNFSHCCLLTDTFPISLIHSFVDTCFFKTLKALYFDFCYTLTDKSLKVLLETTLPSFEILSFRCARSRDLTGAPFSIVGLLSSSRWPRFHQLSCSCTQVNLTHFDSVAEFLVERATELNLTPKLSISGSLASNSLIRRLGLERAHEQFIDAIVVKGTLQHVEDACLQFQKLWYQAMETVENKSKVLHRLVFHRAITILVNAPCSVAVVDDGKGHEKVFCFLQHRQKSIKQSGNTENINNVKVDHFLNHLHESTTYTINSSCAKNLCPLKDFQNLTEQDMPHFVHYLRWTYPLPIAVRLGNLPLVHYLIKKGTYVDVWGYNFATPLYTAASHVLCNDKALLNTSSQDVEDFKDEKKQTDTPVDNSCGESTKKNCFQYENNSRLKMVYLLLKNGAPVDAPDLYSVKCPINAAIKNDNQDLLELFLACGATVNVRMLNQNIIPPLIQLSKRQQQKKKTVKGLARLGYKSPLFVACELQAWRCVSVLLNHKADPHWRDPFSYRNLTPTLLAYRKNSAMLRLFVSKGAGSTEETRWVLSEVLAAAILQDDVQTISFLINTYPDLMYRESSGMWSLPLHQASRLNKLALVQKLLQLGNEPNVTNNENLTPLHFASSEGNTYIIELLVKNGAHVDRIGGPQSNTPLHMAVEENHIEAVEMLLNLNANVTIKNISGMTPLMVAIVARHDKVAPLLIQHASVEALDTLDDNNRSALFYAIHFCQFKVADYLVDKGVCLQLIDSANATAESLLLEKIHSFKKSNLSLNKMFWNFVNVTSKTNTYHTTTLPGKLKNNECFEAYGRSMCDTENLLPDQALDESVKKLTNKRKKLAKQLLIKIRSRFKKPHCTTVGLTSNFLSTTLPHAVYPHIISHKSKQIATSYVSSSSSLTNQSD